MKIITNSPTRIRAVASVSFDDNFVVHDIKIIEGDDRFFIAMPSQRCPKHGFKDLAHPLNNETREKIQAAVLTHYKNTLLALEEAAAAKDEQVESKQ